MKIRNLVFAAFASIVAPSAFAVDASANYKAICLQCHKADGMGMARVHPTTQKPMVNAMAGPRIAGLDEAYILEQTKAVRDGVRKNVNTISMKSKISKLTDDDLKALAAFVSKKLNAKAGAHKGMLQ